MAGLATQLVRVRRSQGAASAATALAMLVALLAVSACGGTNRPAVSAHCAAAASTSIPVTGQRPPVPRHGAYLGAFALHGDATQQHYVDSYAADQRLFCDPLPVAHVYQRWRDPFPRPAAAVLARDHYLLVSWTGTVMQDMASGREDAAILAQARRFAALDRPIFLELRWEMDRPGLATIVGSPATYVAAWDHVRSLFSAAGVRNVSWVWCPTSEGFRDGRAPAYYPGDAEVDWVCADAYPPTFDSRVPYPSLEQLVRPFLDWSQQHDKPVMIGEFGIPQSYPVAVRVGWIDQARTFIRATPRIKALAVFDAQGIPATRQNDFLVGTDPAVVAAYRRFAAEVPSPSPYPLRGGSPP